MLLLQRRKMKTKRISEARFHLSSFIFVQRAGAGGFEPPNAGIKIRCLTTWLRPNGTCPRRGTDITKGGRGFQRRGNTRLRGARPALIRAPPERNRRVAQPGRAPRSGRGGRRFESSLPDHLRRTLFFPIAQGPTPPGARARCRSPPQREEQPLAPQRAKNSHVSST
jgi:hypothetical protein